jgi:hypothetical protein
MVVEHTFVTTLEAPEAMRAVGTMLAELGFVAEVQNAFAIEPAWNSIDMRRGKAKTRRGGMLKWPQQVRVEWDRGRVDVAVAVYPPARGRLDTNASKLGKKQKAAVEQWLVTLAQSIEFLLGHKLPQPEAQAGLVRLEQELAEKDRKARRRVFIGAITFCVVAVAILVVGILASRR